MEPERLKLINHARGLVKEFAVTDPGLGNQIGSLLVVIDKMTVPEAEAQLQKILESRKFNASQDDDAPPPLAPPPVPLARKARVERGERSEHQRDLFQSAGVDLAEESQALLTTLGVAGAVSKNPFRGQTEEPVFCSRAAIASLIARAGSVGSSRMAFSPDVEDLLCHAIEMRMMQVLERLAVAARAAEDAPRTSGALGPVHETGNPGAELKRLAAAEETQQAKKAKKERDELMARAHTDRDDPRVKQLLEEQARQRAAATSSEAALAFARSSGGGGGGGGIKRAVPSESRVEDPEEVRLAKMRLTEGVGSGEDTRTVEVYESRMHSVQRGKRLLDQGRGQAERHVGLRELLFVMDSHPFFRNQRMLATLKSGFVGRGVVGERKYVFANK